ncbi:hypothetical protein L484_021521 [Morus notabilis]|uniref:F-box domain-containing protein n=1 Tax=Morus notabilis TaxID=981085 RepID=W9RSF7_9ROSA|nr:hypothetical protein L484_021521 [Morus notabilis]
MILQDDLNTLMEIDSVDRISDLPDFVLHDILEEAARTCILSKRWNRVWESFPILDFDQYTYLKIHSTDVKASSRLSPEQVGNFLNGEKNSLMRFSLCKGKVQKFHLMITLVDPNFACKVDECLELALQGGAVEIYLSLYKPYPPISGY